MIFIIARCKNNHVKSYSTSFVVCSCGHVQHSTITALHISLASSSFAETCCQLEGGNGEGVVKMEVV